MTQPLSLPEIRNRIDELDAKIQTLVTQRADLAVMVAQAKKAGGDTGDVYRAEREAEVLSLALARNKGPLTDESIVAIFREIMSACLSLQRPLTVAYLGPSGTYTEAATKKHFGQSANTTAHAGIDLVFREVASGGADYGVVPVENSTEGVISHTLDMLVQYPLNICGEIRLPIHHCLLSNEADFSTITKIYTHPQSLAQCRKWLDERLPDAERIAVSSNAEGARIAASEKNAAAVAGEVAILHYDISIIERNIEDESENTTRFLVIGKRDVPATGNDKTTLLFSTENKPGALTELLLPLTENKISMTRIESRPSRKSNWDYVFFIDIAGHASDESVMTALETIAQRASLFRIVGSYPRSI